MHGKEFINGGITTYFRLVTLITAATLILGSYIDPDGSFGYEAFASPLIYAACGVLPNIVMYSRKELTVREVLVRKLIQLVLIEGLVLVAAFYGTNIFMEQTDKVIGMGICIFVIYILVHLIGWLQEHISAKRMTEELIAFQQNHAADGEDLKYL